MKDDLESCRAPTKHVYILRLRTEISCADGVPTRVQLRTKRQNV